MAAEKSFVERGMEEAFQTTALSVEASMRPGAVIYDGLKELLMRKFSDKVIRPFTRPLMSPRRRWAV